MQQKIAKAYYKKLTRRAEMAYYTNGTRPTFAY